MWKAYIKPCYLYKPPWLQRFPCSLKTWVRFSFRVGPKYLKVSIQSFPA